MDRHLGAHFPAQVPPGYYMLTMGTNMYKVWIGSMVPGN